jgi:hypothetical protein
MKLRAAEDFRCFVVLSRAVLNGLVTGIGMAPECHFENFVESIVSQVSSSGGGLPVRPDRARDRGVRIFGGIGEAVLGVRSRGFWGDVISESEARQAQNHSKQGLCGLG